MPVDTRSCSGPLTDGCGWWWRRFPTISGYQQSLRRVAPELVPALEAAFADDERRQFHSAPPATQAVVNTDPSVPAADDVVAHYVDVWNDRVSNAPTKSAFGGPLLIVRGDADAFVTEQLVGEVNLRFVQAEVKVIDKGGHWVHVEDPWAVAATILDFTDSVRK